VPIQIEKQFVRICVVDHRAHRHFQNDVGSGGAVLIGTTAVFPVACAMQACVTEIDQRVDIAIGNGIDTAPASAVTAVGTALGNRLLAPTARGAIAAFSGHDFDVGFVDDLHGSTTFV